MSYLQVPDLDLRVHGSCSKNESIGVELCTGESCGEGEMDLWSEPTGRGYAKQKVGSLFFTCPLCPAQCMALSRDWQQMYFYKNK